MQAQSEKRKPVKTIRLDEEKIDALLDRLDASSNEPGGDQPQAERYRYRERNIVIEIHQPGVAAISYHCPARSISRSVLSCLHGGYVHQATKCLVQLFTTHGNWQKIEGRIVSCQLAEGNVHEINVKFDREIDPGLFCQSAVSRRVLLAEDDASAARLAMHQLKELHAEVDHAENGRVAVELALKNNYDVILMDLHMPEFSGIEATTVLRSKGYMGIIVAFSTLSSPEERERCLAVGFDQCLSKPYTGEDMSRLLEFTASEPLYSSFQGDPSMAELVQAFVDELPAKVQAIQQQESEEKSQQLLLLIRTLKATAGPHGFDIISEAAGNVEKALIGGAAVADVGQEIANLVKLCGQVRV
ncbi:MAG: response regulator [Phycisphaerales bacterium]|nr:response regulator [Phycisphaerales bacterium]